MFKGFSRSVIGASHTKSGTVCQDSSSHKITDYYAVAVVADGHGSKKHFRSNMGSQFAVEAVIETIDKFYGDPEEFEANFPKNHKMIVRNIEKQVIALWNKKASEHLKANPVTDSEKSRFTPEEFEQIAPESYYGSTLIAGIAGRSFTFGIQIGDGSFVAIFDDGIAKMPMEYDESAPANVTASICNANAASMFKSFYSEKPFISMFASTDGLYTSFGSERDFLDYHVIITSQLAANADEFKEAVIKNITKRSHFGTEDDISLSCVFSAEKISDSVDLLTQRVEENKKTAAEKKAELKKTMEKQRQSLME